MVDCVPGVAPDAACRPDAELRHMPWPGSLLKRAERTARSGVMKWSSCSLPSSTSSIMKPRRRCASRAPPRPTAAGSLRDLTVPPVPRSASLLRLKVPDNRPPSSTAALVTLAGTVACPKSTACRRAAQAISGAGSLRDRRIGSGLGSAGGACCFAAGERGTSSGAALERPRLKKPARPNRPLRTRFCGCACTAGSTSLMGVRPPLLMLQGEPPGLPDPSPRLKLRLSRTQSPSKSPCRSATGGGDRAPPPPLARALAR